jgi:hypothetical protein
MREWLYFLVTEDGKSYTMQNGVLKKVSQRTPLVYTPDGWQDLAIGWERDMTKIGIVRNFSIPLGFVEDGAEILRNIIYKENIEAKVYLIIQKLNVTYGGGFYKYGYEFFYKGEIDLSTLKDQETKVTVSIAEGGLYKKMKANEGTVYEIPVDDPESISVKMDGILLSETANFLVPGGIEGARLSPVVPIVFLNKEGTAYGVAATSQEVDDSDSYFLLNGTADDVPVLIKGSVRFQPDDIAEQVIVTLYKQTAAGVVTIFQTDTFNPVTAGNYYQATYDLTVTLGPNEHLAIRLIAPGFSGGVGASVIFAETTIKATYNTRYRETYARCLKPITLFKRLGAKIIGNEVNAASTLLEAHSNLVYTSGDAVRGIAGAKIKTHLNDFYQDNKVRYGAGIGLENNKIVIEDYLHFLNETDPIYLGQVKDLNVSVSTDLLHNTVKIGYTERTIDDVNGKLSFNNSHLYTTPISKVVKELSLISPYIADPYVIELTRINLEGKTTTDNSKDNDVIILNVEEEINSFVVTDFNAGPLSVFIPGATGSLINIQGHDDKQPLFYAGVRINITGSPTNDGPYTIASVGEVVPGSGFYLSIIEDMALEDMDGATLSFSTYTLKRETYDVLEGVSPSVFNIEELTPKRIFANHEPWFNSIFNGFEGQEFVFQTTERNDKLKTVLGSETIIERSNYQIDTNKIFLPFYFEFDTEVPTDIVDTLEANPNKSFSFHWYDQLFIGFLVKAGIAPNTNKEQAYKLLAAPSNDLKTLI